MLLTSSTRRPARLNIQHQERHTVSVNETTSAKYAQNKDKNSVIMRSINIPSAASDARRQAVPAAHSLSNMAFYSRPPLSIPAIKPRVANVILEIGTNATQEKNNPRPIPAQLFPTTNNNITLETMPILSAGPESRVSTDAKHEDQKQQQQKQIERQIQQQKQLELQIQQQKQLELQIQQQKQLHNDYFASPRTPTIEHSNNGVILVTTEKPSSPDKIVNSVPPPVSVEPWKPSWLR